MTYIVILSVALLFLAAILLLKTLKFARPARPVPQLLPQVSLDRQKISRHLSQIIQCKTVSLSETGPVSRHAFFELHGMLEKNYPRLHANLQREFIHEYSLLYTWQGSRADLPGVLLAAHLDVVPADDSSLSQWTQPPFSGSIDEEFVWGRGTLDIKNQVVALMESIENLLAAGFKPARTIYLAFGHDEEIGGFNGAACIAAHLKERGIELAAVLDEGGSIYHDVLPGVKVPVALIGVAEKGYLSLELNVQSKPGHSSIPPKQSAIGILAKALARLEAKPMPARVKAIQPMFHGVGMAAPMMLQTVIANLWLFAPLLERVLQRQPTTNATIRTTTAITMANAGVKDNILPDQASAVVNFRILPGDTIASVCEWVRKSVNDRRVTFKPLPDAAWEASPVSPDDSNAFHLLARSIQQIYGALPVAPFLVLGATDARHYTGICDTVYRFSPLIMKQGDMPRIHGIDERISISALEQMVQFYDVLLHAWCSNDEAL